MNSNCHDAAGMVEKEERGPMERKRWKQWMIIPLLVAPLALAGCGVQKQNTTTKKQSVAVVTAEVKEGTLGATADFLGQIAPSRQAKVVSKISGKVLQVYVQPGDQVSAGQALVQVDTTDLQNQLRQQQAQLQGNQAQLQVSQAQLAKAKTDAENAYAQLLPTLQQAKIAVNDAQLTYQRKLNLYNAGAGTKADVDAAKTALDTAQARYNQVLLQVQAANPGGNPLNSDTVKVAQEQVAQAQASLAQTQALIATTQSQIAQATVTSPFSGVVVSKDVEVGGFAGSQSSVVTVAQLDPVKVTINIPENMIAKVKEGQQVQVKVQALGNQSFSATIARINPVEDVSSKSYQAEVDIPNPHEQLKAGMVANVTVKGLTPRKGLVIPTSALVQTADGAKVFTVENNVAHQHLLKLGTIESQQVEVLQGVKAGDQVVISGQELLSEGTPVQVVQSGNATSVAPGQGAGNAASPVTQGTPAANRNSGKGHGAGKASGGTP